MNTPARLRRACNSCEILEIVATFCHGKVPPHKETLDASKNDGPSSRRFV